MEWNRIEPKPHKKTNHRENDYSYFVNLNEISFSIVYYFAGKEVVKRFNLTF